MTTDHDLLARIKQAQKCYCVIYKGGHNDCSTEGTEPCYSCQLHSALREAMELVKPYLEHNIKNVTKVDGVYDKEQAEAWEKVHGHDIRLNCYPEFGCQLLIDPEDLFLTIKKELHKPDEYYSSLEGSSSGECIHCDNGDYPCSTIQAIERELG